MKEGRALGKDAFLQKYGSFGACVEQKTAEAQEIVDACRTAPQPVVCVTGRIGLAETSGDSHPAAEGLVRAVAVGLCVAEFRKLGAAAFKAKYPEKGDCISQHQDEARAILERCKTASAPKACVAKAVGLPARPEGAKPHK